MIRKEKSGARGKQNLAHPTHHLTEQNKFELYCDMCEDKFFVDKATYEKFYDPDNRDFAKLFICDDCREELGEAPFR